MRLSVDRDDPGFLNWVHNHDRGIRVTLDGDEVERCITADDVRGFVTYYCVDDNNKLIIEENSVKRETKFGKVRIDYES